MSRLNLNGRVARLEEQATGGEEWCENCGLEIVFLPHGEPRPEPKPCLGRRLCGRPRQLVICQPPPEGLAPGGELMTWL